ncbi:ABC transporter ATP-binding protein [Nodosilinea sp. PGN35]|uniref:ABC transporter ATP-binding protein n=1 Tax=Nodosilinea sp. PGN35 TaxID=3020489 RepID=UPI0023B2A006|nr:ABC transporter ATP-binding protein [Nodosilinea sp. TSF1-S3]MDF0366546.1 ABC transporter ATP-binding protein [Nodosilinea sp. TSF1-S3]
MNSRLHPSSPPAAQGHVRASPDRAALLVVDDLAKHYVTAQGPFTVLDGIHLTVQPGEIVCLLGASGCGKSSLLSTIAGLQPADRGCIYLHGQRIQAPDPRIGLIFQEAALLPWLTVQHNVALGLQLSHMRRLSRPELRSRIDRALLSVGLEKFHRAYPHQLSGGMAQRAAIARTIARDPHLLLMDEPFGALDAITRLEMQQLLLGIIAQRHCTALLVTHDLDEALLLGDRILLMSRHPGRIHREWAITAPQPRMRHTEDLMALRAEIFTALSEVMAKTTS